MQMCLMISKSMMAKRPMLISNRMIKTASMLFLSLIAISTFSSTILAQTSSAGCHSASEVSVSCGGAPSATVDATGRLWVSFVQNKHVYVQYSDDLGETWGSAVQVTDQPEDAEFNGENRPKIIVKDNDDKQVIMLSWTTKTSPNFTGEIRFSRSEDGGVSFDKPRTINDDNLMTGHRFDSLFLTADNTLYLTWIDKRDMEASLEKGESYAGAAIYYAVSSDLGKTFTPNFRVSSHSCECCRIAVAPYGDSEVTILWRQLFDTEIRDHAIATLTPDGTVNNLQRATYDDWYINACPHHGPAMIVDDSVSSDGSYHMSWFSAGNHHKGIYYARFNLGKGEPEQLIQVDGTPGAGHPYLARHEGILYLAWKGFNGMNTQLLLKTSEDNGEHWSEAQTLFNTAQGSDHPLLVTTPEGVYVSWLTQQYGYLFEKID